MNREDYIQIFSILAKTQTYMAECIKITRTDGEIFRFTAHDKQLIIKEPDGQYQTYESANSFVMTTLETQNGLAISNMDVDGLIDDDSITEDDLRLGLFDQARVDLFLAYWRDRHVKVLPLRASWIGEIQTENDKFKVDLRGISNKLAQTFTKATSLECRWTFADSRCGITPATHEASFTVQSVVSSDTFVVPIPDVDHENAYQWGNCTFLTGTNAGAKMEILRQWEDRVQLFLPLPYPVEAGDTVKLIKGCDKTFPTCCAKFDNAKRFGGEPFLAGSDMLTRYPVRDDAQDGTE